MTHNEMTYFAEGIMMGEGVTLLYLNMSKTLNLLGLAVIITAMFLFPLIRYLKKAGK